MTGERSGHRMEMDMLAEAANAQFRAADFMGAGVVRGIAPAKVNLFLGVGSQRADGFHDVLTVMHALAMHDVLYVNARPMTDDDHAEWERASQGVSARSACGGPSGKMLVSVDMVDKTADGAGAGESGAATVPVVDNLAFKAADALARMAGRDEALRVRIRIEKQVPAQAGLGGGSSDAACAIACLARQWGIADEQLLSEAAASIGSDVPFFLQGGCALYDGAGERFVHSLTPLQAPVVVVKPGAGVSTARAYAAFDADPQLASAGMREAVMHAQAADEVLLFNSLTKAADEVQPAVPSVREWLCAQGEVDPSRVLLSGSGSALFAEVDSFAAASRIAARAKGAGLWARPTSFSRLRAQVI